MIYLFLHGEMFLDGNYQSISQYSRTLLCSGSVLPILRLVWLTNINLYCRAIQPIQVESKHNDNSRLKSADVYHGRNAAAPQVNNQPSFGVLSLVCQSNRRKKEQKLFKWIKYSEFGIFDELNDTWEMASTIENNQDHRPRSYSCGTVSSPSSSSEHLLGDADDSSEGKSIIPFSLKAVEVLLSLPKAATLEDLNSMVEKCKQMVLESEECSEERKWLVRRLIELRLRAQEVRERSDASALETQVIFGHHLVPQKYQIATSGPMYCDHCSAAIWTMLQSWYMCQDCGFSCHWKCITDIRRVCAHVIASEAGGYVLTKEICPEKGLSAQGYRCAECHTKITFKSAWVEPRLCDYTGLYFCQRCHWNSMAVIPARVIRNWDMEPRKVSRSAEQLLRLLDERPVLQLEELNPKLFTLIPDLSLLKRLRDELVMMKKYLVFCPDADFQGLPWRVGLRTHMIEDTGNYSIRDLVDLQSGVLMEEIHVAHESMRNHITESCELCFARGHLCEICGNDEVIFPWDSSAISCHQCNAVHHRVCWSKRNHSCPRCTRLEKRRAHKSQDFDDSSD